MRGIRIIFTIRDQQSRVTASSNGEALELSGDPPATCSSSRISSSSSEYFVGQHIWKRRAFPLPRNKKKYELINKLLMHMRVRYRG